MSEYDRLWREINGLKKNVRGLSQPQLAFSTVEDGYVTWRDADGNVRLRVGLQEDGTQSVLHMNGPKPPTPSAPTVTVDGVVITVDHDGSNVDGVPLSTDYRRRIVYAGFSSDMSDAVPVATIEPPTGGQAVFMSPGNGTVYVAVRVETHAMALSDFSAAVPVEVTMISLEGEFEIVKDSANGKNKNFYSPEPPKEGSEGDVWFDTSIDPETGQPKWGLNLWDGSKWVSARDSRLQVVETAQADLVKKLDAVVVSADGGNKNFYSTTAPTKDMKQGDLWFDGSKNNTPHRWDGSKWVSVADERVVAVQKAQEDLKKDLSTVKATADGKNQSYYQPTKPAGSFTKGDLWFDTSTTGKNRVSVWDGKAWVDASDKRVQDVEKAQEDLKKDLSTVKATADGKNQSFYQPKEPTGKFVKGDLWFDTSTSGKNRVSVWDGKTWVDASDKRVADVQSAQEALSSDLAGVRASVDGKTSTRWEASVPTSATPGSVAGDTWHQYTGGQHVGTWRWDGKTWVQQSLDPVMIPMVDIGTGTFGELDGARLKVGTVGADKVLVGSDRNLIPDGDLTRGGVGWPDSLTFDPDDKPSPDLAGSMATREGQGSTNFRGPVDYPVEPGDELVFECWLKADKPDSVFYVEVRSTGDSSHVGGWSGNATSASTYPVARYTVPTKWTKVTATSTVGDGVPAVYFNYFYFNHSSGSETNAVVKLAGLKLYRKVGTTIIANGAITTDKIATGAITADSGVVASLDAGKITSGFIDSARIQAGSIRADQIQVSTDDNWLSIPMLANGITTPHRPLSGGEIKAWNRDHSYGPSFMVKRGTSISSAALRAPEGSSGSVLDGSMFPVQAGMRLMFRARLYRGGSYTDNVVPAARTRAYHYKPSGSYLSTDVFGEWVTPKVYSGVSDRIIQHEWVVPDGAGWMQLYIQLDSDAGWVVFGDPVLKPMVSGTLIEPGAITTDKLAAGAITAESGVIGSLDLGKATVGELDGSRIKAGTLTVGQLLSGTPTNVLPGADNLAVSNAGWTGFGRNVSDPSIWLRGRSVVENDGAFELSAGVTYTAATDVKSSVDGTMWFWQLMGQDGQGTLYIFGSERADKSWRTVTTQFTVPKSGRYKLKIWSNHQNGASNADGYQWWRNPRISPAVDTTLIKDGSITTEKIATGAITAESGVIGSLDAGKITAGEMDGARIKAGTVQADKVLVKGSVGSTVIADGAVTTDKIATGAITAESGVIGTLDAGKITVGEMDGARIKANTIGTDLLKAGAVTATILDATAIDGKTITGATIRTSIRGARVQLDSTGIHAYNPNSVETVTISAVTGEASVTGDLISGLPGTPNVRIQNSLWRNAQWSDWDGTTVYATGAGVRIGREDSYGSVGFAEISGSGGQVIDPETEGLEGATPTIKPALVVTGPGQTTTDRASLGFYGDGSALLRSKDGAPLTLRSHSNRGDYVRLIGDGAVKLRSTGGAGLSLTKEGQVILKPGLGGKDSARLYMYDSAIIQTRGGDPAQLRTGNNRANLTVGSGGGEITMRADNTRILSGTLYYQSAPTTGQNPNMHIDSNGWVAKTTSSRRYKHDIQPFDVPDALLDVPFRTWVDKGEYDRNGGSAEGLTRIPGLIAEEVAEACPELVIYDDKGHPDALAGDRIGMAALTLIRRQRDRINGLEERIANLEGAFS